MAEPKTMSSTSRTVFQRAYDAEISRLYRFLVPPQSRVLQLGCRSPALLHSLSPSAGVGICATDSEHNRDPGATQESERISLRYEDVESADLSGEAPFDYIILSGLVPTLRDVQATFDKLQSVCDRRTRVIVDYYSNLWRPILQLATWLGLRRRHADVNWLSTHDVSSLLHLSGFEPVTLSGRLLLPIRIPIISSFFNRFLAKLPILRQACLVWYIVARSTAKQGSAEEASVSIVIPTRNERGNIQPAFERIPRLGRWTELVFVDGHSEDGTVEEIERLKEIHGADWERIEIVHQTGRGKGQAMRQAFEECRGDILMILDSDLTMPPEELPKYYAALITGRGEVINGSRLVYPQEDKAMRFLNLLGNHFFAKLFSWLLGQQIKDTLCGTKVLWRSDYEVIAANRAYFGDFDPFGDFDLLFGAAKQNRKIVDLPIRYRERTYGEIKIDRWRDGALLLRMSVIAFRRLKLS